MKLFQIEEKAIDDIVIKDRMRMSANVVRKFRANRKTVHPISTNQFKRWVWVVSHKILRRW